MNGVDRNEVKGILTQLSTGPMISFQRKLPLPPYIACTNTRNPKLKEPYDRCQSHRSLVAMMRQDSTWVYLCPNFLRLPLLPAKVDYPSLIPGETRFSRSLLVENQVSQLTHELVHLYMGRHSLTPEVYEINACTGLSVLEASINSSNYDNFLACASFLALCLRVPVLTD